MIEKKWRIFSSLIFLAALFFYLVLLWSFKDKIPQITANISNVSILGLSVLLATLMIGLGGIIWLILLRDHKIFIKPAIATGLFAVSQFGKYLPGNVGQFVGRVLLGRQAGIPVFVTLNTLLIETLWVVASGGGLALLSLFFFIDPNILPINPIYEKIGLITLIAFLLALPWVMAYLINGFFPGLTRKLTMAETIPLPKVSTAIKVSLLFILSFFIMGLILKLQAHWLFNVKESNLLELTCLFTIAWLAGYVVPGAPGGLGVREIMIVFLLSPVLGVGVATGLSLTLRLTTVLGDALAFALGLAISKKYDLVNRQV